MAASVDGDDPSGGEDFAELSEEGGEGKARRASSVMCYDQWSIARRWCEICMVNKARLG